MISLMGDKLTPARKEQARLALCLNLLDTLTTTLSLQSALFLIKGHAKR